MFRKGLLGLVLLLLLTATTFSVVQADFPPLPHAFYGRVYINGEEAPGGTRIEGRVENVKTGIQGNPIETVAEGFYGSTDNSVISLVVQGEVTEGAPIEFYVNGEKAYCSDGGDWEESYPYHAGGITALDLWVGPLEAEEVLPTMTRTPTFAPTVPRTATAQPQSATATAGARVAASTTQPTPDDALPTATLTLTPTHTPTEYATAGEAGEGTPVSGVVDSDTAESEPTGQPPVTESTPAVQPEANGTGSGWVVGIIVGIIVVLVVIWLLLRRRENRPPQDEGKLL